jgi:hypothetical protein
MLLRLTIIQQSRKDNETFLRLQMEPYIKIFSVIYSAAEKALNVFTKFSKNKARQVSIISHFSHYFIIKETVRYYWVLSIYLYKV